jgi:antitoxin component of MazEF toxin-antitoxin module
MPRGEVTTLTKASNRGDSLRTTIPMSIVRQFDLKEGDKIQWEFRSNGKKIEIIVSPTRIRGEEDEIGN